MRFLIRNVKKEDHKDLLELAGVFPLCSLPNNSSKLEERIYISEQSFKRNIPKEERNYIFVLEDLKEKKIIGSSQILSYIGKNISLCYFLKEDKGEPVLELGQLLPGRHQVGGLILDPEYRQNSEKLGLKIGLVRFLYIKSFPEDFSDIIEASLTANIKNEKNHFWEETAFPLIKVDYKKALELFQKDRLKFFSLFPKNLKINLKELSETAKNYLKEVHPQTSPVYKGLLKRGFHKTNHHHLLDGGLYLEAYWKKLDITKNIQECMLQRTQPMKSADFLLSQQTETDFICGTVKGSLQGSNFLIEDYPAMFEGGRQALALNLPM